MNKTEFKKATKLVNGLQEIINYNKVRMEFALKSAVASRNETKADIAREKTANLDEIANRLDEIEKLLEMII